MDKPLEIKATLRSLLRDRRKAAHAQGGHEAALALRDVFLAHVVLPPKALVAAYSPCGSEIDPQPLLQALEEKGYAVCLPCLPKSGDALVFRAYALGDPLQRGAQNIPEPLPSAALVDPDIFLVPLLGFNRAGHRLGQGGGFYDRALCHARTLRKITALGLAYSAQEELSLPLEPHDECLDAIVTESDFVVPLVL
ncbi:MAG: 5-formyltetrahydrofolate cyclo-ligase [Bdellovibrionales bacterium]|jgi:5-formyltetrahydrofolate cyclo-ligase